MAREDVVLGPSLRRRVAYGACAGLYMAIPALGFAAQVLERGWWALAKAPLIAILLLPGVFLAYAGEARVEVAREEVRLVVPWPWPVRRLLRGVRSTRYEQVEGVEVRSGHFLAMREISVTLHIRGRQCPLLLHSETWPQLDVLAEELRARLPEHVPFDAR